MERWNVIEPDPEKPNHYFHDSLGDPFDCDEDHNHPPREAGVISERLAEVLAFLIVGGVVGLIAFGVYAVLVAVFG